MTTACVRRRGLGAAALLAALLCLAVPAAGGTGPEETGEPFVAGFEDLPLMPGLTQVSGAGMVFDTPGGRIVEAYAEGTVPAAEVLAFYARTLPQLGWRRIEPTRYRREGESLRLEVSGGGRPAAPVTVHFYLSPE